MRPASSAASASNTAIPGLALVDYDNLRGFRRKSQADFELHTTHLVDTLIRAFRSAFPDIRELDVRFYGGWMDEFGGPSRDHIWLLETLPSLRGRRHGLIVRPALATAMLQFPELILRGTVRHQAPRPGRPQGVRQKMVDGMLGCDAVFAAAAGLARIGVVTDDDDLVPATLSANAANSPLTIWMRPRRVGAGLNDRSLIERGLSIRQFEESHA